MPHGLGHHVIMKMADWFLERGHHLFFDNCFSSVKLGQDLEGKGTYMCSTIHMNRSGWPKELNAQCAKKIKAGNVHFRQYGNTVATQWKDKRPGAILYTNTQPEMGEAERKATWEERGLTNSSTEECQSFWEKNHRGNSMTGWGQTFKCFLMPSQPWSGQNRFCQHTVRKGVN